MKKLKMFINKFPLQFGILAIAILFIIVPFLINFIYKLHVIVHLKKQYILSYLFLNEIPIGDLLTYYGTAMTSFATLCLSFMTYRNNALSAGKVSFYIEKGSECKVAYTMGKTLVIDFITHILSNSEINSVKIKSITIKKVMADKLIECDCTKKQTIEGIDYLDQNVAKLHFYIKDVTEMISQSINNDTHERLIEVDLLINCNGILTPISLQAYIKNKEYEKWTIIESHVLMHTAKFE